MVEFNPTHEVREGVDVVWQIPPNPTGVLYLAHSANGTPFSYWPSCPNVPQCTGVPEHKKVTKDALELGFAVIANTSVTNEWETWPASNVDIQNGIKTLKAWTHEHGLEDLPLSAWGTSCGGDYVSGLATAIKMHSLVIMISRGHPEALKAAVAGEFPATLFVPMINDEKTFSTVKENVKMLRAKGIPSAIVEAPPLKVHPHFFAEHIDELDNEQSAKLHSLFVEYGVVSEDNSLTRVLMKHDVEPYLRKADILPTTDDSQRQQDEEKLKGQAEGGSKPGGGRGPGGGAAQVGGRGGPPGGGRGGGRGPPSTRGESGPAGGRGEGGHAGGRGMAPSLRGEGPPAGGRGPSAGGRGPPGGGRGGGRGSGPPDSHPLANGVSNQLMVAQGNHTLTARHNKAVFEWLQGKGWPNAQA